MNGNSALDQHANWLDNQSVVAAAAAAVAEHPDLALDRQHSLWKPFAAVAAGNVAAGPPLHMQLSGAAPLPEQHVLQAAPAPSAKQQQQQHVDMMTQPIVLFPFGSYTLAVPCSVLDGIPSLDGLVVQPLAAAAAAAAAPVPSAELQLQPQLSTQLSGHSCPDATMERFQVRRHVRGLPP